MSIKPVLSYFYDQYDEVTFWQEMQVDLGYSVASKLLSACLLIFFSLVYFFLSPLLQIFFFFYFANMSISERIISFISYFMCSPGPFTWPDAKGKAVFQSKALDLFEKMHFKSIEDRLSKPQLISIWSFTGSSFRSGLLNHWPFVALPVIFTSRIEI